MLASNPQPPAPILPGPGANPTTTLGKRKEPSAEDPSFFDLLTDELRFSGTESRTDPFDPDLFYLNEIRLKFDFYTAETHLEHTLHS